MSNTWKSVCLVNLLLGVIAIIIAMAYDISNDTPPNITPYVKMQLKDQNGNCRTVLCRFKYGKNGELIIANTMDID